MHKNEGKYLKLERKQQIESTEESAEGWMAAENDPN